MEEDEIDKEYLDENFVKKLNTLEDESLRGLIEHLLSSYSPELSFEEIETFSKELSSMVSASSSMNTTHFIRQLKYLINKGIYSRINKKYKAELVALGIDLKKVELLAEVQKTYHDINMTKNEEAIKDEVKMIKSFDMFTDMPIGYSDYPAFDNGEKNEDIKKQKVFFILENMM